MIPTTNPEYYYVWGITWDSFGCKLEYTYRPPVANHAQYVVLDTAQAIIFRLTYPEIKLNPYHQYSYQPLHLIK